MSDNQQMRTVLVILIAFALVVTSVVLLIIYAGNDETPVEGAGNGEAGFRLHSASGVVTLEQFRGQVVLLFFGYTHCPDICPTTMSNVAAAMDLLTPAEQQKVQPIFITVDPERDSAGHLAEYVGFFHPKMIGLSGTMQEIRQAAKNFSVEFFVDNGSDNASKGNYLISHTSYLFLIDKQGKVSDMMSSFTTPQDIAATVRKYVSR